MICEKDFKKLKSKIKNCKNTNTIFDTRDYVLLEDIKNLTLKKCSHPKPFKNTPLGYVVCSKCNEIMNDKKGWDVFAKKVVKYAYIEDGAVMRGDKICVGNIDSGDFLEKVPSEKPKH